MTLPAYASITGPVTIGGRRGEVLTLANPVLAAAGCFGDGSLFARTNWLETLGGLVTPTCGLNARRGRPSIVHEAPAGVLYHYRNLDFGTVTGPRGAARAWQRLGIPVIVSLAADTPEDVAAMAGELASVPGVAAIELNPDAAGRATAESGTSAAELIE